MEGSLRSLGFIRSQLNAGRYASWCEFRATGPSGLHSETPYILPTSMSNSALALELAEQFCKVADRIHGLYLDATMGMGTLAQHHAAWDIARLNALEKAGELTDPSQLNPTIAYAGKARGEEGELHSTSMHELISRNFPNGTNWRFLANMCVVAIYQYWEYEYRGRIADALQCEKNKVVHPVLGELRQLRRSIIHNGGRAVHEVGRSEVLPAFAKGVEIALTPEHIHDIAAHVQDAAREASRGASPEPAARVCCARAR